MMGRTRPRGRRSTLRGIAATALGVTTLGLAAGGAAAQQPQSVVLDGLAPRAVVAGSDEAMWLASPRTVARVATSGAVQRWSLPEWAYAAPEKTGLVLLADGALGFVLQVGGSIPGRFRYVEARDGTRPVTRPLPRAANERSTFAVTPDRSVWFARTCEDRLWRVAPGGEERLFRLRRLGCRHVDEFDGPWRAGAIRRGPDGVTWLVNRCQGRIVRVDRRDRLREWHLPPACDEEQSSLQVVPGPIVVRPDGTLALAGVEITPAGRLVRVAPSRFPDAVTPDGTAWFARPWEDPLTLRTADGAERTVEAAAPGSLLSWAVGPDGLLWHVRGRDVYQGSTSVHPNGLTIQTADASGRAQLRLLGAEAFPVQTPYDSLTAPLLAAGPDGAMWAAFAGEPAWDRTTVLRLPAANGAGTAQLRIVRLLERDGGRVWLQLSCAAQAGRFCSGALGLSARGARIAVEATRFAIPGGARQTVTLMLTDRAQRLLRRGSLRATARATGATTATKTVTVPR